MLMGEDLLVACAQITHDLAMPGFDMTMQVRPSQAGNVTIFVRTVIPQKQDCILQDFVFFIFDAQVLINFDKVLVFKLLKLLLGLVCEDNVRGFSLAPS